MLQLISILSPFLILLDHHRKKDIHIAVIYICTFYMGGGLLALVIKGFNSFWIAAPVPAIIFLYAWLQRSVLKTFPGNKKGRESSLP
jgi:hypothetical protein